MSIHVVKKLANNFSSLRKCSGFDEYPRQLPEVNRDGGTDIIGFSYDALHLSLIQSDIQINTSQ